jgi:hypothetical protein
MIYCPTHFNREDGGSMFLQDVGNHLLDQWFSNGAPQEVARFAMNIMKVYFNKKFWEELIAYFPWYDMGHIENDASNNPSIVVSIFVTTVTFLSSRCLAMIGGLLQSRWLATISGFLQNLCLATIRGLLPSHCLATIGGIHRQTNTHIDSNVIS